jgi:acyl carrier protein
VNNKLKELLKDVFALPDGEINDDLTVNTLETWDSLKHMELVVAIEKEYGVDLSVDEIISMKSVDAIKTILKKKNVEV